jgi:hypothetical protein
VRGIAKNVTEKNNRRVGARRKNNSYEYFFKRGYWGYGGNGTFTQFPINPLFPLYYKNHRFVLPNEGNSASEK